MYALKPEPIMATTTKTTNRQYIPDANYLLPVDSHEGDRYIQPSLLSCGSGIDYQHHTHLRLLLQHNLFKSAFGNRLLLPPHNKETSYDILDSATGTGAVPCSIML